jgi:hypothetical protein
LSLNAPPLAEDPDRFYRSGEKRVEWGHSIFFEADRMQREYTHEINREIRFISGYYQLEREEKIEVNSREVIYAIGYAVLDSACCGTWGCRYALVPGYVLHWKSGKNSEGIPVSIVEPITDEKAKEELTRLLEQKEWITQVQFW